jgi:hypothetical protein
MRLRVLIITALLPLVVGCSAIRLAYGQGPELAYWWLDAYADFTAEQSPRVRDLLHDWFAWHRATQLDDYVDLLASARLQLQGDSTPQQACAWFDQIKLRLVTAYERAVPAIESVGRSLAPEQIEHMERRFAKTNEEFQHEYLQALPAERLEASVKRALDRAETLYGRLDDKQRTLLADRITASPFEPELWIAERRARQQQILAVARMLRAARTRDDAATADRLQAALRALAIQISESPRAGYRAYAKQLNEYNCSVFAQLHNTTTASQRKRAAEKLKGWEDDLRALAAPKS